MAPLIIHKLQDLHKFPRLPFPGVEPADSLAHAFCHRFIGVAARLRVAVAVAGAGASQARRQLPLHRRSCRPHPRLGRALLLGAQGRACQAASCASETRKLLQRHSCRPRAGEDLDAHGACVLDPHPASHHHHVSRWCRQGGLPAPCRVQALHWRHPTWASC